MKKNLNILKSSVLVILVLFSSFLYAQNSEKYHFNHFNITDKVILVNFDSYGNIYCVDQKNTISKFDLEGKLIYSYSNPNYGAIASIDVDNPEKIMIFYKDAAIILFLNEQFAPITNPINLFNLNYFNISLAAFSNTNTIFIFDQTHSKLILLDFYLKEISQFQLLNTHFNPTKMVSWENNKLVIHDPKVGLLFFDSFGTLEKEINLLIPNDFQMFESKILYLQDATLKEYNFVTLEMLQTPLNEIATDISNFITVKKSGSILVGLDNQGNLFIGKRNF